MKRMIFFLTVLLSIAVAVCGGDKLRVGYGAGVRDSKFFAQLKANGFNAYIWKMGTSPVTGGKFKWQDGKLDVEYNQTVIANIKEAAEYAHANGIKLFLSTPFNKYTAKCMEQLEPYGHALVDGPRSYLSAGVNKAPWPGEPKYWRGIMQEEAVIAARLAKEVPGIAGFLFDLEMYGGKINWWHCATFDDNSLNAFRKAYPDVKIPELPLDGRYRWLEKNNLLGKYYAFLSTIVYAQSKAVAAAVARENPDFKLGFYSFCLDWFHPAFARGVAEGSGKAVMIFNEDEYNYGLTPAVPATLRVLDKYGLQYEYLAGLHLVKHRPDALAAEAVNLARECSGYWLYTMASLSVPSDKLPKGYRVPEGTTQQQYWDALKEANRIIAAGDWKTVAQPEPLTGNNFSRKPAKAETGVKCTFVPEPLNLTGVPYRQEFLFDGLNLLPGVILWEMRKPFVKDFSVTLQLSSAQDIGKIALSVPFERVRNFRIVFKFRVCVEYYADGKWKNAFYADLKELKNPSEFFNIDRSFTEKLVTDKVRIRLQVLNSDAELEKSIANWNGLFIGLAEVAIYSK